LARTKEDEGCIVELGDEVEIRSQKDESDGWSADAQ